MVRICNQSRLKKPDRRGLRRLAQRVLEEYGRGRSDVTITLLEPEAITDLNRRYLNHNRPTDVIAFNLGAAPNGKALGDIYICPAVAAQNAGRFGCTLEEELARLVVHGVLHFLGFDDATPQQKEEMHRLEDKYLEKYAP